MKQRNSICTLILDCLLLIPGVLGSVFCLITAFSLPASSWELWGIAISSSVIFSILLGHRKRDRMTAPLILAILLVPAYLFRVELVESFRNLWGVLSSSYAKGYDFFQDYVPTEPTNRETVGTALLAITVLEAYFGCLAVRVWKRTVPAALIMLLCVVPCFILTDTPPDALPLLVVIFIILTQAFSQSVRRRGAGEQGKAVLAAALVSATVLALLTAIFPEKSYTPPITWDELAEKMEHWQQKQNNRGNVNAGLTGNPASVDLSGLGALPNRPFPIFYVTASEDGHLYLRGSSYTEFDGEVWSRGKGETWRTDLIFPYLGEGGATLSIETVETEPLLYTTYQLSQIPDGTLVSDAYLRNDTQCKTYTIQYRSETAPVNPDPRYDKWVRENCLELPSRTRTGVRNWWEATEASRRAVPDADHPEELLEYVESIAEQVSHCAKYSRNPAQMPEDADFCAWFLNDASEGYCVHFASSCTSLLRAIGIPARYVSGYVCDVVANKQSRVTNLQAHAWVEAWIGGRWVPIEPTPSDATEFTGLTGQNADSPPEETDPRANRDRPRPTAPDASSRNPNEAPVVTTELPAASAKSNGGNGNDSDSDTDSAIDLTPLWIFLGVIGLPLLAVERRCLKNKRWDMRLAHADPNEKALLLYRHILLLQKHCGGTIPEDVVSLVKKACYSQHTLSENELAAVRKIDIQQVRTLSDANFWKRLYYKYVLAIL